MENEISQLRVFFFPFMAHGHMIPIVDIAKMFGIRGVKTTIVTTHGNVSFFSKPIEISKNLGIEIDVKIIKFPCAEAGLPEGCEYVGYPTNPDKPDKDLTRKFYMATAMLQEPLEVLLRECKPDCLVADLLFPWATDAAAKFGIPRLVFHGTSFFSSCIEVCMSLYKPYENVLSDSEPFVVPNLPGNIKFTRKHLPDYITQDAETWITKFLKEVEESELKSFGVVVNSFYELEPAYADHYRKVLGRRAWHIGPVSVLNRSFEDQVFRGKQAAVDEVQECLKWLNSKKPNSVVYLCFGSAAKFAPAQLMEIAIGLEASGLNFIWVVGNKRGEEGKEDWLPEGFEKRMESRGLVIRGWAPQVLILDHEAVGGFVTHCGWNSNLEAVTAGVPMVTWPLSAEQFYNENLVTQILKIGVRVGVQQWGRPMGVYVTREAVEKAVKEVMEGDKAEEMRSRAKALGQMAQRAVEKGGSSYSDLNDLIEELSLHRNGGQKTS